MFVVSYQLFLALNLVLAPPEPSVFLSTLPLCDNPLRQESALWLLQTQENKTVRWESRSSRFHGFLMVSQIVHTQPQNRFFVSDLFLHGFLNYGVGAPGRL